MKWFDVNVNPKDEDINWALEIGNNITEPNWTIRPYKLSDEELQRISYITNQIPVKPSYAAIIMVPAQSVCKTHIDDKADASGIRQRITAINIPIQVHETSVYQYMESLESQNIIEEIYLNTPKCWRVDIPHRVDNSKSPTNRVVLSLSYVESVDEIYNSLTKAQH